MRKVFFTDWKRAVLSMGFLTGIIGLVIAGICGGLPAVTYMKENRVYDSQGSWIYLAEAVIHSELFLMAIPLVSSLAYGAAFSDELKYRFALAGLVRTGWRRYLSSKVIVTALSGGLIVLFGVLLLLAGITLVVFLDPKQGIFMKTEIFPHLTEVAGWIVLTCFSGSLWALLGGFFAAVMKNKYMVYTTPFILYYVLNAFQERYYSSLYILNPREWAAPRVIQIWEAGLMVSVVGFAAAAAFVITMERRLKDA